MAEKKEFKQRMFDCLSRLSLENPSQFARHFNIPETSARLWFRGKPPRTMVHQRLLTENFPDLFDGSDWSSEAARKAASMTPAERQATPAAETAASELTKKPWFASMEEHVAVLSMYFDRLVYECSPSDRDAFRAALGPRWERLLNQTRALVGERARNTTFDEGRLERR